MEYRASGSNEHMIGETKLWRSSEARLLEPPASELQFALARGAGELRDLERRIQRIQASTERVLASSRGLLPAYSPLAAEIAEAAQEAEQAQRQIGSTRAFLENSTGPVGAAGAFAALGAVAGPASSIQGSRGSEFPSSHVRLPFVEIRDNGKEFLVRAELPGMSKEDIEVEATEGSLRVLAEQEDKATEAGQLISGERLAKQFERTVALPEYVVPSKAMAAFRDGILEVTLPKKHPGEPAQRLILK